MLDDELHMKKAECRTSVKKALARTTAEDRMRWSALICEHLERLPLWALAREVLLYSPMAVEVDTTPLVEAARDSDKAVFFPRLHGEEMVFHAVDRNPLQAHSYGMLEPPEDAPRWPGVLTGASRAADLPDKGVLIVCPGLAFDASGRRLGRGKAFYDRFINSLELAGVRSHVAIVGICFGAQLVDEVPAGPRDEKMDGVITEAGLLGSGLG